MAVQLIYYASKGNIDKIKECLNKGVHVEAANFAEETALFHAVLSNRRNCVQFLLKLGANPNRCSKEGFTPVNAACFRDNVKCLSLLVRYGGVLEKGSEEHKESAMVTAIRHNSSKSIKLINSLKKEALTREGKELKEQEKRKNKDKRNPRNAFPGASAVVPCIEPRQLRRPHNNYFHDNGPHVVLECALWEGSPVTVKRIKEQSKEYVASMLKDADVLSQLKHPQVALLMAVYLGPISECVCLVLEPFVFGSLYNLLHGTHKKLDLERRLDIMKDAAQGLSYLHDQQILHCYFNSFSVLICKNFRAKIANLEYSQVNEGQRQPLDACVTQEKWMAPEQLRGEPASIAADVYSFGATFWECLSRKVPWSWLDSGTVKDEMFRDKRSLPILDIWPECIKAILQKCLGEEHCRENIGVILGYLTCARNSGEINISGYLDVGFQERFEGKKGVNIDPNLTKTTSDEETRSDSFSNIHILVRRSTFTHEHSKVEARPHSIFGVSRANKDQCWRQSEIDSFGYKTAEQIAYLRRMRRRSKSSRREWAKEVVLKRYLDGDSKRMSKTTGSSKRNVYKRKKSRRGSVQPPENLHALQTLSLKYKRKVWAKLEEGQERARRDVDILPDSLEDREVELTRFARSFSSDAMKESTSQDSQKLCVQVLAPCSSSHNSSVEETEEDQQRTKRDVEILTESSEDSEVSDSEGQERTKRGSDSSENSEVEVAKCVRSSTCNAPRKSSFEDAQKHCVQDITPCSSSQNTNQAECILVEQNEDTKHEVRSYKSECSIVYTGLSWLCLPTGMAEVERDYAVTSRPDSDSKLMLYRRVQCEGDVIRAASDSKLSQKRHEILKTTGVHHRERADESTQNDVSPRASTKDEQIKMAVESKSSEKLQEVLGCPENELQMCHTISTEDGTGNDVTSGETDVTHCPVYAITTPVLLTTKAKPVKTKTTEQSGDEPDEILAPSMRVPVVLSTSVPCISGRSENSWHSRSLQDIP